jgi:hypothetical protein
MVSDPSLSRVQWRCWRLVPSIFPPVTLFESVANPDDLDVVFAIESLTNDRLRDEVDNLNLVPPNERISGPGTSVVMAAFTHVRSDGSRFSDGSYGIYYVAERIETAIAETRFHRERFLRATKEAPIGINMRSYASDIDAQFHDIRGMQSTAPELYAPDPGNYGPAQALGKHLRANGSDGLAYDSVRDPGGECAAIFRPKIPSRPTQETRFRYEWDGTTISRVYELVA